MSVSTVEAPADQAVERRSERYAARHTLWDESKVSRVRSCGRSVQSKDDGVRVKVSTGTDGTRCAGYSGLQTCGSVWACPVCSAKVASHRQGEIQRALTAWIGDAGPESTRRRVALATLTMAHRKGQRLRTLWDALSGAWHSTMSGRGWKDDQAQYGAGRIPFIRVVEVTHGEAGWHVHVHALLLLPADATEQSVHDLGARMFGRWSAALVKRGMRAPRRTVKSDKGIKHLGVDIRMLTGDPAAALGDYFTKAVYSAAAETARADMKDARYGNRTPFAILRSIVQTGDADDLDTWHEWERGSKGRRQIAWSRGLRAELLTDEELTDEQVAEQDAGGEVETTIDRSLWRIVMQRREDYAVLRAFEESKRAGLAFLMALSPVADTDDERRWENLKSSAPPPGRRF